MFSLKNNRILSLDVFRGLTIILMIIVNSPGNQSPYPLLEHANWNGCTFADLVFPSFLFIVGITTVISVQHQVAQYNKRELYQSIAQRSLTLFAFGLFLNVFPHPIHIETLRVYGILQRIALCYFFCSLLYLNTTVRQQLLLFLLILIGYWILLTQIPVPGIGSNQLTPTGSWVSYIEHFVFASPHLLFGNSYDPEGLLSTLPAIATTLAGVLIGQLLLTSLSKQSKYGLMTVLSLVSLILGWFWSDFFPINKNLWTSSFVLWSGGWLYCVLLIVIY